MNHNKPSEVVNGYDASTHVHSSSASRYNKKLLRALRTALKKQPDVDIISLLPSDYSHKLSSYKNYEESRKEKATFPGVPDDDIRSRLSTADKCTVIAELSPLVKSMLAPRESLSTALISLLANSEIIYKSAWSASVAVCRANETIAIKITGSQSATTEDRTLRYLQKQLPDFPTPKPHGLVSLGGFYLLFETFVDGSSLEEVWPQLGGPEKRSISVQLNTILTQMRSLSFPANSPFGEVEGGVCRDARRGVRTNTQPIMDLKQFEDFVFSGVTTSSETYVHFMRRLKPNSQTSCVFTHGDIRPGNIMVEQGECSSWRVVALIDWESSGFYPAYWESVKTTNNLTPRDECDWYLFLPETCSPRGYPVDWLVDKQLDSYMAHR